MTIIDEALKKLGASSSEEGGAFPRKNSDLGLVVGTKERSPFSFLLAIALIGAGLIIYLLLPDRHEISPPVKITHVETTASAVNPVPVAVQKSALLTGSSVAAASSVSPIATAVPIKQIEGHGVALSAVAGQSATAPDWYDAGWTSARSEKWTEALVLWEAGLRGLPKDRMLIVSNSYSSMDLLSTAVGQHAKLFPAIGVRQYLGGQILYRVIVFPYGGGTRQILPKVQKVFLRAGLVNAARVQDHMSPNSQPTIANAVPERLFAEKPVANQNSLPAQNLIADSKETVEKPESANSVAPVAVVQNTGEWETRSATVRDLLKSEDYAGVVESAGALTRDFSERWEGWFWLGTAQIALGRMDAAEVSLEHAGKLNPKVAQIWVQRAVVAQERGDHAAAVKLLNMARELSPKSPQIYLNLGYSNDALGLTQEADKSYLRFLSLTEGDSSYALQRKPIIQRLESRH